eukprot:992155-Pyramimonas_sp.AAC.1
MAARSANKSADVGGLLRARAVPRSCPLPNPPPTWRWGTTARTTRRTWPGPGWHTSACMRSSLTDAGLRRWLRVAEIEDTC